VVSTHYDGFQNAIYVTRCESVTRAAQHRTPGLGASAVPQAINKASGDIQNRGFESCPDGLPICRDLEAHLERADAVHFQALEALRVPGRAEDAAMRNTERVAKLALVQAECAFTTLPEFQSVTAVENETVFTDQTLEQERDTRAERAKTRSDWAMILLLNAVLGALLLSGARSMSVGVAASSLIGLGMGGEADIMPYRMADVPMLDGGDTVINHRAQPRRDPQGSDHRSGGGGRSR